MAKNNDSPLKKNCFPYFIELSCWKQRNNRLQITSNIQISDWHERPALSKVFWNIFKSLLNYLKIREFLKKYFGCYRQFYLEISKKWYGTKYGNCFLKIRPSEFCILFFHGFCDFNLFKIWDTEKHFLFAFKVGLKIKKVIIFMFIMRRVRHGIMNN